jgi:hypothetical protein
MQYFFRKAGIYQQFHKASQGDDDQHEYLTGSGNLTLHMLKVSALAE